MAHFRTIRSKLSLLLILCIFCSNLFALLALSLQQQESNKLLYNSTSEALHYGAERFNTTLSSIEDLLSLLLSDSSFLNTLRQWTHTPSDSVVAASLLRTLSDYCDAAPYVSFISIFYGDRQLRYAQYYPISATLSLETAQTFMAAASEHPGSTCLSLNPEDPEGLYMSRFIRRIDRFAFQPLGTIVLRINIQRLLKDLAASNASLSPRLLLASPDQTACFSSTPGSESLLPALRELKGDYGIVSVDGEPYFSVSHNAGFLNWNYYYLVSYATVSHTFRLLRGTVVAIILISSCCIFLAANYILRGITVHFSTLRQKMDAYSLGQFEPRDYGYDYSRRHDELGEAHEQLDTMASRLQILINDNYVKQLLIRDAKLRDLQHQIHPHFLYNTLESITWYAQAAGEEHIPSIVHALGNILRSSLSDSSILTFRQELGLLQDYISIQQLRYADRLIFHLSAPEEVLHCQLPKMTLVPLVENAIRYALEEMIDACEITVEILVQKPFIRIYVRNTGSAFSCDTIDQLHQKGPAHGFGIGLNNIQQRIQLTYGEQYGIKIYNQNEMAVVEILLPFLPMT